MARERENPFSPGIGARQYEEELKITGDPSFSYQGRYSHCFIFYLSRERQLRPSVRYSIYNIYIYVYVDFFIYIYYKPQNSLVLFLPRGIRIDFPLPPPISISPAVSPSQISVP
jgi:hypothetical protein